MQTPRGGLGRGGEGAQPCTEASQGATPPGTHVPGAGAAASGGLEKSGSTLGKGMLMVLPLWGLEKPLEAGETEPREWSPSEVRFFSGSGGCPGPTGRKGGRKPLSAVTAAARRAPGASVGDRPPPPGAAPKPVKAGLLGGSARASAWPGKAGGSSAGARCGRPGPGPGNWLGPRRLLGGWMLPGRAGVGLGLVSTHGCSADTGLFRRQSVQADAGRTRVRWCGPRAPPPSARPRLPR